MKNEILRRMTAVLLAVVCIITGMPEMLLTVYADETQVVETEVIGQPEQITETEVSIQQREIMTEEAESTEQSGTMSEEAAGAEETENTEETEEMESTEWPETVTEEAEPAEQTETAAGEAESAEQTEDTENTEQSEIPAEEAEILEESAQSTENVQETEAVSETEIMYETETVLETETMTGDYGIILPADAEETGTTTDASYTDANGIVYSYYGYEDGTADIYAMADYDGKEVVVPAVIDGYTVTQITAQLSYDTQLVSLTLPETIIFLGEYCFQVDGIGTLYYNATEAAGIESVYGAPFLGVAIGNLVIGDNVRVIPDRMFYQAGFAQDEVVLSVETIRESAFSYAEFQTLTITDSVRYLYGDA